MESETPSHDGYPLTFVPIRWDGLAKTSSEIRFRERGRDPLPSLCLVRTPAETQRRGRYVSNVTSMLVTPPAMRPLASRFVAEEVDRFGNKA